MRSYMGMRIVEDRTLSEHVGWDFSRCRSPARAARRHRRRGFPLSKMVREIRKAKPDIYQVDDMLVMHPDTALELRRQADAKGINLNASVPSWGLSESMR
jgi:hypothetical protein